MSFKHGKKTLCLTESIRIVNGSADMKEQKTDGSTNCIQIHIPSPYTIEMFGLYPEPNFMVWGRFENGVKEWNMQLWLCW